MDKVQRPRGKASIGVGWKMNRKRDAGIMNVDIRRAVGIDHQSLIKMNNLLHDMLVSPCPIT